MKILLAEDEPVMLLAISTRLKNDGYEVVTASDGMEALNKLETFTPDLIITDILMPYTSGLELIGMVKSNFAHAKIPIIVLSALGQEATVMEAFQLGADDFLTKPLDFTVLKEKLKEKVQ